MRPCLLAFRRYIVPATHPAHASHTPGPLALPARSHQRVECDPSNYARVHKKPRCPAPGCKEKLTSTNKYLCKDCGTEVCLKHRFPADHRCPGKVAAAAAAQGRLGSSLQGIRRMFSSGGGGGAAAAAAAAPAKQGAAAGTANGSRRTVGQKAAAAASKTKDSIQSQLVQYRDRHRSYTGGPEGGGGAAEVVDLTSSPAGRAPRGASAGAAAGAGPEVCQQCGSRFATVQQLIQHAESAHAGGWSSGNVNMQQPAAGAGGLERCPYCTFSSADPVQLVAHVQQRHRAEAGASTGGSTCVLC